MRADAAPARIPVERLEDPRLADYRDLRAHERLTRHGLFVAETRHVLRRLLEERLFAVRSLLVTETAERELEPVLRAHAPALTRYVAAKSLLAEVAGYKVHQGCLALVERGDPEAPQRVIERSVRGRGLLVVLEGIANPDNVGGIFRNALGFGADGVLLAAGGADPLYRKSIRVSMGATLQLPFARLEPWPEALAALRRAGFACWAAVAAGAEPAIDASVLGQGHAIPERVALVLGGEGTGVAPETVRACDACVTIPMAPGFDSLNVATAAGILLHRLGRWPTTAEQGGSCVS